MFSNMTHMTTWNSLPSNSLKDTLLHKHRHVSGQRTLLENCRQQCASTICEYTLVHEDDMNLRSIENWVFMLYRLENIILREKGANTKSVYSCTVDSSTHGTVKPLILQNQGQGHRFQLAKISVRINKSGWLNNHMPLNNPSVPALWPRIRDGDRGWHPPSSRLKLPTGPHPRLVVLKENVFTLCFGRTWQACTESSLQPYQAPLGWTGTLTASQTLSSSISVGPHKCFCIWMGANPCSQLPSCFWNSSQRSD